MDEIRLRPHPHLLRRGIATAVAFFIPAFGVMYFLTVPNGPWVVLLIIHLILILGFWIAFVLYLRVGVWVSRAGITEQGFFTRTHRERDELGPLVFVNTFHGGWVDTVPQLFVCDRDGKQRIRLRGQFWSDESMRTIASTLDLPLTELDGDISNAELHEQYPGLLYWFERRPALAWSLFAATLAIAGVAIYLLLLALGVITIAV